MSATVQVMFCVWVQLLVTWLVQRVNIHPAVHCAPLTYTAIKFTLKQLHGVMPRTVWELAIVFALKRKSALGLGTLELGAHLWGEMGRTWRVCPAQCGTDRCLTLSRRGSSRRPGRGRSALCRAEPPRPESFRAGNTCGQVRGPVGFSVLQS